MLQLQNREKFEAYKGEFIDLAKYPLYKNNIVTHKISVIPVFQI